MVAGKTAAIRVPARLHALSLGALVNRILLAVLSVSMVACVAETVKPGIAAANNDTGLKAGLAAIDSTINPGDSLKLTFTLENNSTDAVRVLPWNTPLEAVLSADLFEVTYNDEILPYRGRVVKRAPPVETDYLTIEAGSMHESVVNLSQAYDVRGSGLYSIRLKPVSENGQYRINDLVLAVDTEAEIVERL